MKQILILLSILSILILFSTSAFSTVEVFSGFDTVVKINSNNTMDISKYMTLRNIHTVGIVPGSVEFKINKHVENSVSNIDVSNINVIDRYGNKISHKILETKDYSIIALEIFTPILPGFEYKIDLSYTIAYDPSGLFFKSFEIPTKEITTIPIQKSTLKLELPENYHFTYLSEISNNSNIQNNIAFWELDKKSQNILFFEYSYIPINIGHIRGSVLFWILINMLLFIMLFREIKKEVKKFKKITKK